ncbi:hypothetical protein H4R34_005682, partial [Dimargaris verticillata]
MEIQQVLPTELSTTERGTQGFGSTDPSQATCAIIIHELQATPETPKTYPLLLLPSTVGGKTLRILFDPGSTNDFISDVCAHRLCLSQQPIHQTFEVQTVDSQPLVVTHSATLSICVQKHTFSLTAYVLPKSQFDIILGQPWIHRFLPRPNWSQYSLFLPEWNITWEGKPSFTPPVKAPALYHISAKGFDRALRKSGTGFVLLVKASTPDQTLAADHPLYPTIQAYQDTVFAPLPK